MKKITKRILTVSTLAIAVSAVPQVSAANWSDTFVGYRYGTEFTEPKNNKDITKHILSLTHVSGYDYGQNFFNLDLLQSDENDPAAGTKNDGALEAYVTYRHQLHLGKVFDADLSFGPVKEVALTAGLDLNTKNTGVAPRKKMLVIGPTLKFDVPKGFLDLSVLYAHERNHNAFNNPEDITFNDYTVYNLSWGLPFNVGVVPMKFQGFGNYNTAKGKGTTDEQLVRTSLMVDVGQLAFNKSNTVWAGVGYEYWRNKFGIQGVDGLDTDAATVNLEWHF
ncbi:MULTISPECIES: outer membrane protein OmpK [Oceanisphaera]|uniref:Outer membrane protein OmpK n=1 Tax=Oceanisphaera ostreae TaxID=914151 RepID=A0ABW3KL94_9GAMM